MDALIPVILFTGQRLVIVPQHAYAWVYK